MAMRSRQVPARPERAVNARAGLARTAIAAALAAALAPCAAQGLPAAPGVQVPGVEGGAPRRGNQAWVTETSFRTQATLTNNANYGDVGPREGDLILEFAPAWRFNRQGGRLRVDGTVSLDMIGYVDGTQASSILPRANVLANLEAIDNFFFIDASLFVDQQVENVFLPTSRGASTNNLYTSSQLRLAPYFQGNIGQNIRWLVRTDQTYTWTSQSDAPLSNAYYARNLAEVVRVPTPFGLTLRLTNDITRIQDQLQEDQTLNTALAIFDYAVSPQLKVGLRGGYENTTYTGGGDLRPHLRRQPHVAAVAAHLLRRLLGAAVLRTELPVPVHAPPAPGRDEHLGLPDHHARIRRCCSRFPRRTACPACSTRSWWRAFRIPWSGPSRRRT